MKYEYCQVSFNWDRDKGDRVQLADPSILVWNGEERILTSTHWIKAFNELGKSGWEMCGQMTSRVSTDPYPDVFDNPTFTHEPMYFFKRSINDD